MLLTSDSDNLLLDEPDNFLDIVGKRWLEEMIEASPRTILLVSHDRELLARSTRKIVTLEGFGAWVHGNSFATYYEAREARQDRLEDALQRWNEEERRLYPPHAHDEAARRHLRRQRQPGQRRRDPLEEVRGPRAAPGPHSRPADQDAPARLGVRPPRSSPAPAHRREGVEMAGLVHPFDLLIRFGERVAIVGPNGTGKSHFVRLVAGEPVAHEGTVTLGARIKVGAFNQMHEHPEWIGKTVIEILAAADLTYSRSMAVLARYELQQCENQTLRDALGRPAGPPPGTPAGARRRQPPAARRADRQPGPRLRRGAGARPRRVHRHRHRRDP